MSASKESDLSPIHQWEHGWDEHERMQLQRLALLPLADKLAWLEEAHRVTMRLGTASSPPTEDPVSPKK